MTASEPPNSTVVIGAKLLVNMLHLPSLRLKHVETPIRLPAIL
jgi:hypothetical protein